MVTCKRMCQKLWSYLCVTSELTQNRDPFASRVIKDTDAGKVRVVVE